MLIWCAFAIGLSPLNSAPANMMASSYARAFLNVVRANNNAAAAAQRARRFVVDGSPVGRVLEQSAAALANYPQVFEVTDAAVTLRPEVGTTLEARSVAVGAAIADLRSRGSVPMLRGWRDEEFAIRTSFFSPASLIVERAAAGLFGAPAYGVFVTGFTVDDEGTPEAMWLGRRVGSSTSTCDGGPHPRRHRSSSRAH
jgi:hypothetical protein